MDIIEFLERQFFEDLWSVFSLAGVNTESAISAFIDDFPRDDVIAIGDTLKENETFELKDFNDRLSKFTPLEISKMTRGLELDFDLDSYKFLIKDHEVVSLNKIEPEQEVSIQSIHNDRTPVCPQANYKRNRNIYH